MFPQWAQYYEFSKRGLLHFAYEKCCWLINSFSSESGKQCTLYNILLETLSFMHSHLESLSLISYHLYWFSYSFCIQFMFPILAIFFFFIFVVLQATFPEQPQEPSYIKLQHKDDVRIMNPHLHPHLYSDLPGYKLGRSSGILSRSFPCKWRALQLLSRSLHFCVMSVSMCVCDGR